ncbi:6659_t:CDS:2 [Acaulospora morrowiae]|uniref:6659_t:CDS:1 n=1 Tax=Acaulospora morrowiae TaxID=94023 RepID=A0A9N8V5G7_9GLOM|nr:6659_t:CDS:2 [Acaulospora morrowiae]
MSFQNLAESGLMLKPSISELELRDEKPEVRAEVINNLIKENDLNKRQYYSSSASSLELGSFGVFASMLVVGGMSMLGNLLI